nr:ribonuclease H-like domain-containing protein [Tanacetum cinerariifolium]
MAFISSSKNSSGNEDGNIACVSTASTTFITGSVNVDIINQDTASAYIASQSNGSQIKFEDINQIDEDDMKEMDIKWSMALLSMRADKFYKRIGKKISIQGSDVAGFDKAKVECFNCHKMGYFVRECRAPRSQERGRKESYRQGSKTEEKTPKALMSIDGGSSFGLSAFSDADHTGCIDTRKSTSRGIQFLSDKIVSWMSKKQDCTAMSSAEAEYVSLSASCAQSYMENEGEDHALVTDEEAPTEFALMANTKSKELKLEKDGLDGKLAGLLNASKNLDHLIKSQRSDQVKEGVGYNVVPPPAADLYLSPK